ncbi:hypothetical protein DRJ16_07510, partial [Candidatus Woesearchaeota archaeon]
ELDSSEVVKRILVNTLEIINPFNIYSLNFYYQLLDFDIFDILNKQKRIVENSLQGTECFEVRVNTVKRYPEMVSEVLKSGENKNR